jgi:hypothetical protein
MIERGFVLLDTRRFQSATSTAGEANADNKAALFPIIDCQ